ncbi:MAG: hypothetical protein D6B28_05290 [Gammaproteobacteria bacterium]|nr:MAG: hypothetical protein D6B28_05290 [Gammaproteobacteria bacterium]
MIDNQEKLQDLISKAISSGVVAVDTEFVWEKTYYPILGLIQIGLSEDELYLVDTVAIKDLDPIKQLLEAEQAVKIFHDAQGDLSILCRETGASPKNIYDTRLAAGFTGLAATISLRNLLAEVVEVELSKSETRTDWAKRPLSQQQVEYALEDIRYLHKVYQYQLDMAEHLSVKDWMLEEMKSFDGNTFANDKSAEDLYKKVKGVNSLNAREIAIVRELAVLRDETARKINYPKGWVISDHDLTKLARNVKGDSKNIVISRGHWGKNLQQHEQEISKSIEAALALPEERCPQPRLMSSEDKKISKHAGKVMDRIRSTCEQHKLDPMVVTSKAEVTAIIKGKKKLAKLTGGWRGELLGASINSFFD